MAKRVVLISKAMLVSSTQSKAELIGQKVDLTLITPTNWPYYVEEELATPVHYRHIKLDTYFEGRNHFHLYRELAPLIKELRPDLIHIDEEPYSLVTYQVLRIAKKLNIKTICFTWQNIYKKYPFPFYQLERYVYKHIDFVVAGNQEAVEVLRAKGYNKPVKVIPQFGVDTQNFKGAINKPSSESADGRLHLGYVGRLIEEKGLITVMEALVDLPTVHFSLVGTGPYEEALKKAVQKYNLQSRVSFLGGKSSIEVAKYISSFDALILPSLTRSNWKEQFGRVLPEAMISRVAVIGSSSGEIPNVIGDAGLVFKEGDSVDCSNSISRLLNRATLASFQTKGYERAIQLYTQESIVDQTLRIYKELDYSDKR